MATREELRKRMEDKARPFWYEFNAITREKLKQNYRRLSIQEREHAASLGDTLDNALQNRLLTEEEITASLQRASIAGLLAMTSKKEDAIRQNALWGLMTLDEGYGCKRCIMHYFDYPIFTAESINEPYKTITQVKSAHPIHKTSVLYMQLNCKVVIGGNITFYPEDMPEVRRIRHEIKKYQRLERRLEKEGSQIPGNFPINEQIKREIGLIPA